MRNCSTAHSNNVKYKPETFPRGSIARHCSTAHSNHVKYKPETHTCNCLRSENVGETVLLRGHVSYIRAMNAKFFVLRDSSGSTQIIMRDNDDDSLEKLKNLSLESSVEVEGTVALRPESQMNKKLDTGEIEVFATKLTVYAAKKNVPFQIRNHNKPVESTYMRSRGFYLRYPEMQRTLKFVSRLRRNMMNFLEGSHDFVNVQTPTLSNSSGGGANLFQAVPTKNDGDSNEDIDISYGLVQSPQLFKQQLMVSGLKRYYQFATCYRNEGSMRDRQPEFQQVRLNVCWFSSLAYENN